MAIELAPPTFTNGAPTKLTNELAEKICGYIAQGNYASVACHAVGISPDTMMLWKRNAEQGVEPYLSFLLALKDAEAQAEVRLVGLVGEIATSEKQWAAAMTLLERRHPQRWGR
ncbi:hypothetical protein LCGC14_1467370, partial [marine sediment metagenome]